ncbi:MAG: pyruvate kinase [Clostridia bacterium]
MRKTKIICTLGPSTDDENILRQLVINGMDVARINMSHGSYEEQRVRANMVKKIREEYNKPVALLLDTKGPEVRTKSFAKGRVMLEDGQEFTLTTREVDGDETICTVTFASLPNDVENGTNILIDDGLIAMHVISKNETDVVCKVINGGPVSNNKGINIPGCKLSMPYVSQKDREDIAFAVKEDFDFIAASFVRTKEDVLQIREELQKNLCDDIKIIAKIENGEGVENIDEIIRTSDGIMVARGDMGVELNLEDIPVIQKRFIAKCVMAGKQVVTATQMLESMVKNPRPTRAEATDVANAIYDGTSAIMLSGETAAGKYPVQALKTMSVIAKRAEDDINYISRFRKRNVKEHIDVTNAISHATCTTAHDLGAAAILTASKTGQTARLISKFRPNCPIVSGTSDPKVLRQMNLSWGVLPILIKEVRESDKLFDHVVEVAQAENYIKSGDIAVITAGMPLGVSGTTNMLKVHLVGNILVEGHPVNDGIVTGRLCVCNNEEDAIKSFRDGDILAIPSTSNNIISILRKAKGIVTEIDGANSHAAVVGLALNKPVIIGANNATQILTSGTMVKLDAKKGIVINVKK